MAMFVYDTMEMFVYNTKMMVYNGNVCLQYKVNICVYMYVKMDEIVYKDEALQSVSKSMNVCGHKYECLCPKV